MFVLVLEFINSNDNWECKSGYKIPRLNAVFYDYKEKENIIYDQKTANSMCIKNCPNNLSYFQHNNSCGCTKDQRLGLNSSKKFECFSSNLPNPVRFIPDYSSSNKSSDKTASASESKTGSRVFWDVDSTTEEGFAAIELKKRGYISGKSDFIFDGKSLTNRAEISKFLLSANNIEVKDIKNNGKFSDIVETAWYRKYVLKANKLGIVNGYPDGSFKPGKNINTAEFIKMFVEAFKLPKGINFKYRDVNESDWFSKYAGVVEKYNLFPNRDSSQFQASKNVTRNEVAVAIWKIIKTQSKN